MAEAYKILAGKPWKVGNNYIDNLYKQLAQTQPSSRDYITIVHIADPHVDLWYDVGSIADCGNQFCCRNATYTGAGSILAGKFGSRSGPCDPPQITFQQTLEYIRDTIQPDVIIWTGDNSPHDEYSTNQAEVTMTLNVSTQMIQNVFPNMNSTIFACYGNHDAYPNNQYNFKTGNQAINDSLS